MTDVVVEGAIPPWTLTDRLRKAREHRGLEQTELAMLMGVSRRTVVNYEAGRTRPRRPQLIAWALATGVSLAWLEVEDAARPKGLEPLTFWTGVWEHTPDVLVSDRTTPESFTCPRCGNTSYHHEDVKQGYCGYCHDWTRDDLRADDLALTA